MATHFSILAWRILERSLAGYYCPWSCKELAQEMTLTSTLTLKKHRFEMHRSMSWSGPHCLWLAESVDGKLQVPRDECKVIHGFSVSWRVGAPKTHIVQGSAIILRRLGSRIWAREPFQQFVFLFFFIHFYSLEANYFTRL